MLMEKDGRVTAQNMIEAGWQRFAEANGRNPDCQWERNAFMAGASMVQSLYESVVSGVTLDMQSFLQPETRQ